jgi:hypothetical protein
MPELPHILVKVKGVSGMQCRESRLVTFGNEAVLEGVPKTRRQRSGTIPNIRQPVRGHVQQFRRIHNATRCEEFNDVRLSQSFDQNRQW